MWLRKDDTLNLSKEEGKNTLNMDLLSNQTDESSPAPL